MILKDFTMKRINTCSLLLAASFLAVLVAGCQKDTVTLRARIAGGYGGGKVYMNTVTPCWNDGDLVSVNGVTCTLSVGTTATTNGIIADVPASGSYKAIYPGSFRTWLSGSSVNFFIPGVQTYEPDAAGRQKITAPMGACTSNPANLQFHNLGGLLEIQLCNGSDHQNGFKVTKIEVSSVDNAVALWGDASVADLSDTASYYVITTPPDDAHCMLTLNCEISVDAASVKTVYVAVPQVANNTNNKFKIGIYASTTNGSGYYERTQSANYSGNIQRNAIVTVPNIITPNCENYWVTEDRPVGALSGKFTVNASGKQVYFSAGNLQYQASTDTWRFAPNQEDVVGLNADSPNLNTTNRDSQEGWIDLFGWGTSGFDFDYDLNDDNSHPTAILCSRVSTTYNYYGYGPSKGASTQVPSISDYGYTNFDWGVYNDIDYNDATAPAGTYRTLTKDEFSYLLLSRRVSDGQSGLNHNFDRVSYNGVTGYLIYPDSYNGTRFQSSSDVTPTITAIPEGCAFLPFAGYRSSNSTLNITTTVNSWANGKGTIGCYWTATRYSVQLAYAIWLNSGATVALNSSQSYRNYGFSVRLVTDVPAAN